MQIIVHGDLPEGVRDHGVFAAPADAAAEAHSRLLAARNKVAELRTAKATADRTLKCAVQKDDGRVDLNALSRTVHRLAKELAGAEEELEKAEAVRAAWAREHQRMRFAAIQGALREARQQFAEHYREAALALGHYYALGTEARELANSLADRLGNGGIYYSPDLKNVLAEASEDPNPLPALREAGYGELQTFQSWRRHCAIVPIVKEKS